MTELRESVERLKSLDVDLFWLRARASCAQSNVRLSEDKSLERIGQFGQSSYESARARLEMWPRFVVVRSDKFDRPIQLLAN